MYFLFRKNNVGSCRVLINSHNDPLHGKEHTHGWAILNTKEGKKWFDDFFGTENGVDPKLESIASERPNGPFEDDNFVNVNKIQLSKLCESSIGIFFEEIKLNIKESIDTFYMFLEFDEGRWTEGVVSYT